MAPKQTLKSVGMVRPRIPSPIQYEMDILRGLCRSAKVGCLVVGILCFGFMFVMSLLLVVSGVAALWLGNNNDLEEDDVPKFFDDPFDTAGIVMLVTGVVMFVGLLCLWWTAERRQISLKAKTERISDASPSPMPSGTYLLGSNSYTSNGIETPTVVTQTPSYPSTDIQQQLEQSNVIRGQMSLYLQPRSNQDLVSYPGETPEGEMSYPSAPSDTRMSYSVPPSEGQLSYLIQTPGSELPYPIAPSGGQMAYPVTPPGVQMSYPGSPSGGQNQYTRPTVGQMVYYPGHSRPFTQPYLSNGQAYQPQALSLDQMIAGLPTKCNKPGDGDDDFPFELPPPYTP